MGMMIKETVIFQVNDNTFEHAGIGRRQIDNTLFSRGDKLHDIFFRDGVIMDELDEDVENYSVDEKRWDNQLDCCHCKKRLPSPHFLDLHISEVHDSYFKAQAERKPMYRCFIESCHSMSQSPEDRRKHCIETHKFPHDFRFDVSYKSNTKVVKSVEKQASAENAATKPALDLGNFTFGRSTAKGRLFVPKGKAKEGKSNEKPKKDTPIVMDELMDTLPTV